ncbi:TPA: antiviral RADAR system adenosine triphosphatase RdrA [Proteus mirabilis]
MSRDIILQLKTNEYEDEFFSSEGKSTDESELWQLEACEEIISFLQKAGNEAKEYSKQHSSDKKNKSYHHSIYINGDRGTGKTVFLRNVENIWRSSLKSQRSEKTVSLFFCDIIDPTLLEMEDRFSDVIIATIYAAVDEKLKEPNNNEINSCLKKDFFQSLKLLADSLGNKEEFNDLISLDRIIKYRSGIQIEKYFHDFLKVSTRILQSDAIVISIDDIDMKSRNAFDVLDDIRRLMGCPYIIPLITGDIELYGYLCDLEFESNLLNLHYSSPQEDRVKKSNDLSKAYLTKVFPTNRRIELVSANNILARLIIKENDDIKLKYSEYKNLIKKYFYFLCNSEEKIFSFKDPQSAREITQLIRLFQPTMLQEKNDYPLMWDKFKIWAEEHQDGDGICNALSYLQLKSIIDINKFSLKNLISFNINQQVKSKYKWKDKNFSEQNIELIRKYKNSESESDNYNLKLFNSKFQPKTKDGNKDKKYYSLRSMPVLELVHKELYISKNKTKNENLLLELYTYNNYYSVSQNKRNHIFFSRAYEILAISIILLFEENIMNDVVKNIIINIFNTPPFYSIFSLNPTKMIDESENENENENENVVLTGDINDDIDKLSEDIITWINNYNDFREKNKNKNIIPLLSSVFNKIFTQLNILKNEKIKDSESLFSLIKRFEYITINAFASFIKKDNVINSNLAITAQPETILNFDSFIKRDNTLSPNLSDLISKPLQNKKALNDDKESIFIELVWNHPIFKLNDNLQLSNNYIIGKRDTDAQGDNNDLINKLLERKKEYQIASGFKNIVNVKRLSNKIVKNWAKNNNKNAKEIFYHIINVLPEDTYSTAQNDIGKIYWGIKSTLNNEE